MLEKGRRRDRWLEKGAADDLPIFGLEEEEKHPAREER